VSECLQYILSSRRKLLRHVARVGCEQQRIWPRSSWLLTQRGHLRCPPSNLFNIPVVGRMLWRNLIRCIRRCLFRFRAWPWEIQLIFSVFASVHWCFSRRYSLRDCSSVARMRIFSSYLDVTVPTLKSTCALVFGERIAKGECEKESSWYDLQFCQHPR
jgi:hypothetical protein